MTDATVVPETCHEVQISGVLRPRRGTCGVRAGTGAVAGGDRSTRLLVSRQPAFQHGRLTVAAGDLQRRARGMAVASGGTRAERLASSRLYWPNCLASCADSRP